MSSLTGLMRFGVASLALTMIAPGLIAQQTGTIVGRTPGSAINRGITVSKVIPPKPTCDAPAEATQGSDAPLVPELLFSRDFGNLVCVRHTDGQTEQFHSDLPVGILSPDGLEVAYWIEAKHELHVASTLQKTDMLVDSMSNAAARGMTWSAKGHILSYFSTDPKAAGIHAIDMESGRRQVFPGSFIAVVASPDAGYVEAVGRDGVERFAMADGRRELVAKVTSPSSAEYSKSGALLGILANAPAADANMQQAQSASTNTTPEDDTPDCSGGSSFLIVQDARTKRLIDVPYPKGFDTVLDFAFSPDDRTIAVTFGVAGCDYPGEKAQIFLVSLPDLRLTPISPEDRLSVQPEWTPDGKVLVYSDYRGSDSPLVAFDLQTHKLKRLTNPGQFFGPDSWVGWR